MLVTTLNAPPAFLTRNYLTRNGIITVSEGDEFKARAADLTRGSAWVALGGITSATETFEAQLKEYGIVTNRIVNVVALLGHNLRRFIIEYSTDGTNWLTVPGGDQTGADYASPDIVLALGADIDVQKVRVTATEVQAGVGSTPYKEIGDVIVAAVQIQPTQGMSKYTKSFSDNMKSMKMADGSTDYTHIFRSPASFEFFSAAIELRGLTQAQRDAVRAFRASAEPFLFYPEPGNIAGDVFLCRIANGGYSEAYLSLNRNAGYMIRISVEEIGAE